MSTTRTLPLELVQYTITLLDPDADRDTLVSCLTVSKACWKAAAGTLYRTMRMATRTQFDKLFRGDSARDRMRQYFSFVHRLELGPWMPFGADDHAVLWSWAVPGEALFPNVRQLLCHIFIYPHYKPIGPPDGIYIFDHLDEICVQNHDDRTAPDQFLPSKDKRPVRTITTHCDFFYETIGGGVAQNKGSLWRNGGAYHIYDRYFCEKNMGEQWAAYISETERTWQAQMGNVPLTLSLLAKSSAARDLLQDLDSAGWKQTDNLTLELGTSGSTAPCTLCGKSFRDWSQNGPDVLEDPSADPFADSATRFAAMPNSPQPHVVRTNTTLFGSNTAVEAPQGAQWTFKEDNPVTADVLPKFSFSPQPPPPPAAKNEAFSGWAFCRDNQVFSDKGFTGFPATSGSANANANDINTANRGTARDPVEDAAEPMDVDE